MARSAQYEAVDVRTILSLGLGPDALRAKPSMPRLPRTGGFRRRSAPEQGRSVVAGTNRGRHAHEGMDVERNPWRRFAMNHRVILRRQGVP